jgi:hypothetical protein
VKGKSEQMMEYIKKLRACIKWLLEGEDANLAQIGKLTADLEAAETQHGDKGTIFYLFSNIRIVALFPFFVLTQIFVVAPTSGPAAECSARIETNT